MTYRGSRLRYFDCGEPLDRSSACSAKRSYSFATLSTACLACSFLRRSASSRFSLARSRQCSGSLIKEAGTFLERTAIPGVPQVLYPARRTNPGTGLVQPLCARGRLRGWAGEARRDEACRQGTRMQRHGVRFWRGTSRPVNAVAQLLPKGSPADCRIRYEGEHRVLAANGRIRWSPHI